MYKDYTHIGSTVIERTLEINFQLIHISAKNMLCYTHLVTKIVSSRTKILKKAFPPETFYLKN